MDEMFEWMKYVNGRMFKWMKYVNRWNVLMDEFYLMNEVWSMKES